MLVYLQLIDSPGEQSRFEKMYITYRKLMFHVAKGILGNDQDAEDAVHDAFLAIAKNFDKISTDDRHKTKAFVVIVVENKAIDLYRKKQRHPTSFYADELSGMTVEYEAGNDLSHIILKLSPRYRDFILLKYSQGYGNAELAELFGISQAGIRQLDLRRHQT